MGWGVLELVSDLRMIIDIAEGTGAIGIRAAEKNCLHRLSWMELWGIPHMFTAHTCCMHEHMHPYIHMTRVHSIYTSL